MVYFRRGDAKLSLETRLNAAGPGYQLVIIENGRTRIESFAELQQLVAREHDLLRAWLAQGSPDLLAAAVPGRLEIKETENAR